MRENVSVVVADSVTRLGLEARGGVALCASHCGLYAAYLAARARVRAVILNDAGIGRERAGVAGLAYLQGLGLPAAAASNRSCRIGDGADTEARGVISVANAIAMSCGVVPGMSAREAANRFAHHAEEWKGAPPAEREARVLLLPAGPDGPAVSLLDSVSGVVASDHGQIIVTGSHGGLLGGKPETASKVDVFAALYNDADVGIDGAGLTRLPALDGRGIAGGTVSAWSARIGDGRSTYADGFVSHVNETARRLGAEVGMSTRAFVEAMRIAAGRGSER